MNPLFPVLLETLRTLCEPYSESVETSCNENVDYACVAAILRLNKDFVNKEEESGSVSAFDLLYILRAQKENDPWSGHVAFPGGRCEPKEKLLKCVIREVWEEIGVNLNNKSKYQFIGCLKKYPLAYVKKPFVVQPFVFLQISSISSISSMSSISSNAHNNMTLNKSEVSDVAWINLNYFCTPRVRNNINHDYQKLFTFDSGKTSSTTSSTTSSRTSSRTSSTTNKRGPVAKSKSLRKFLNNNIKFVNLTFKHETRNLVVLPLKTVVYPGIILECTINERNREWLLWGLTYRLTGKLLSRMGYKHYLKLNRVTNQSNFLFQAFGQLPKLGIDVVFKFKKIEAFDVAKLKQLNDNRLDHNIDTKNIDDCEQETVKKGKEVKEQPISKL